MTESCLREGWTYEARDRPRERGQTMTEESRAEREWEKHAFEIVYSLT